MTGTLCLFSSFVKRLTRSSKYNKPGHSPWFVVLGLLELIIYKNWNTIDIDINYNLSGSRIKRASDFGFDAFTFNLV